MAMSKTGGASLASGLLSALASKIIAVAGGPSNVAILATLQQARQAGLVAATANGQTALVQGTGSFEGSRRREYVRTAAWIMSGLTFAVSSTFVAWSWWGGHAPGSLAAGVAGRFALAPPLVGWLAAPLILSSVFVFMSAMLNALGGVGALAGIQVATSLAMLIGAPLAARFAAEHHPQALVGLMAFAAAVSIAGAALSLTAYGEQIRDWFGGSGKRWSAEAARHFFAIAGSMSVSGFAASTVLLMVRGHITKAVGLEITGQFDAAWNVSMNQASLVLGSLQTHYLPALVSARDRDEKSGRLSSVLMAGSVVAAVVIAVLALAKPWVLTILYSRAFRPATACLRWTLLGDYLKVSSWIVSIPILAAADMKLFLFADLLACSAFPIAAAGLEGRLGAAEAASVGFVLMYVVHLSFCAVMLWKRHRLHPSRSALLVWCAGLGAVGAASAIGWNES